MNTFSKRLKTLRLEKGLNGLEFCKRFDIGKSTLSGYEHGTRKPNHEMLKSFAEYFGVSLDYLLGVTEDRDISHTVPLEGVKTVKGFAVSIIERLIQEGIIKDKHDIDQNIIDMIVAALVADTKSKKR